MRSLGAGGMGEVHEAIDTRSGQHVALKMIFEVDPAGVYRLKREFRRMAGISHENLVTLHELGNDGDRWYFTMELLHGGDLGSALRCARLGDGEALRGLLSQLAHGVHALHQAGKIHRDLKPSNVLVTDAGRVVILDFGLVNEIDHRTLFASSRGLIRGTPHAVRNRERGRQHRERHHWIDRDGHGQLGANDGLRGLPVAEARHNLGKIIARCQAAGARVLLAGMQVPPNMGPECAPRDR